MLQHCLVTKENWNRNNNAVLVLENYFGGNALHEPFEHCKLTGAVRVLSILSILCPNS